MDAETYITLYSENDTEILVYEDWEKKIVKHVIANQQKAILLADLDNGYTLIRYEFENEEGQLVEVEGYVNSEYVMSDISNTNEENPTNEESDQQNTDDEVSEENEVTNDPDTVMNPPIIEPPKANPKPLQVKTPNNVNTIQKTATTNTVQSTTNIAPLKSNTVSTASINNAVNKQENVRGVAKKKTTNIRVSASTKAKVLRKVPIGQVLNMKTYSQNWYEVNIGGQIGYIHKKHVTVVKTKPVDVRGVAKKKTTNIRVGASTKSKVLRKVPIGHVMSMKTFSKNWYEVTIGGQIGYIHRKHVTAVKTKPVDATLFAMKSPTNVRVGASTKANVLTKIPRGTLLKLKTFSKNWYSYTATINGKLQTGYIHRKHVGVPQTVVIDAGHGGHDPGARGNGLVEKDINLDIAKRVQKLLESAGYKVIMTRTNDQYLTLPQRSSLANNSNAAVFVSIHTNAGGGKGIETWWYSKGPQPQHSYILAQEIQSAVIKETKTKNRGVKDKNLHVNRETKMPSALVEVGFIDNKNDAAKLKTASFKQKVAVGIANGIINFLQKIG